MGSLYSRQSTGTISYLDDFSGANDISNWTQPTGAACWSVTSDSGAKVLSASGNLSGASDIWRGLAAGNFNFQVKMKITATGSSTGGAGIVFRSDNSPSSIDKNEYYLCLRPSQKDTYNNPAPGWDLQKVTTSGGISTWATLSSGALGAGFANLNQGYHTLGVAAAGSTYRVYVDGVRVCTVSDSALSGGSVGLAAYMANVDFAGARLESPANGTATYYRYNEVTGALQAELDSSGTVTASYVTGPGGSPISVTRGGKTYFYHTNAHGDVTAITGADGNPLANFTYDAWGVPTELTAQGQSVPIGTWAGSPGEGLFFLFGGILYDAATGLYLTKSRVYDPKTGRFLSRDILDESGKNGVYKGFPFGKDAIGTNLYGWCLNDPVTRVDPSGQWSLAEIGAYIGAGIGFLCGNEAAGAQLGAQIGGALDTISGYYGVKWGWGYNGGAAWDEGCDYAEEQRAEAQHRADAAAAAKRAYEAAKAKAAVELKQEATQAEENLTQIVNSLGSASSYQAQTYSQDQMFNGGPDNNLILNCKDLTKRAAAGQSISVNVADRNEDWGGANQRFSDYLGGNITVNTVTSGISLSEYLGMTSSGPLGVLAMAANYGGHYGYYAATSATYSYHLQDVRDYCGQYGPPWPDPYHPALIPNP